MAHGAPAIAAPTLRAAYSTIAGDAIASAVGAGWDLGRIEAGVLLNRGFNDVYELGLADGSKRIARLSGTRFRGPANIGFETAFLAHLQRSGVTVGAAVASSDGALWRVVEAPEGPRVLAVFERLTGRIPLSTLLLTGEVDDRAVQDIRLLGADAARIHVAGESYDGPPSLYRLEADHLLRRPMAQLLAAATLSERLRAEFAAIGEALGARMAEMAPNLASATCHGDNHGGNTFMSEGPDGSRIPAWFDFDDAGPGWAAYDLATFLWGMLRRSRTAAPSGTSGRMWTAIVEGYREVRPLAAADFEAIGPLVGVRQFWFLGEFASRIPQWGMQNVSRDWLRGELGLLRTWDGMATPAI